MYSNSKKNRRKTGVDVNYCTPENLYAKKFVQRWYLGRRRLMTVRLDGLSLRIKGPESVPEQILRIIQLLNLPKAVPVIAETSHSAFRRFVPAQKLGGK